MRALALMLVAACGSHAATPGDDGGTDGQTVGDAPIDVPFVKGTVHVTVSNATAGGCDTAQLHAVFVDVDGTTTDLVADASGAAQADVFPGASVTAVCVRSTGTVIAVTVNDIEPGDDITLDASYFFTGVRTADTTAAGTFKISFPPASGATSYTIYYPCGNVVTTQTNNVQLSMKAGCLTSSMDLVVVAGNNTGPTQWTQANNVAFANNGSVTVTDTWHGLASVDATYTNAPAFCGDSANPDYPCDIQLQRFVPDLHGFRAMAQVSGGAGTLTTIAPGAAAAVLQTRLENNGPAYQVFTDVVDGTSTTYALDFAAKQLPWMCQGKPQCPTFDGGTATLTIPVSGSGSYDLFYADVEYVRGQQILWWRVFGPTAGDLTYPVLPAPNDTIRPTSADHQSVTHARICESDALAGWHAARQNPFDALNTCVQSTNPTAPRYSGSHNRLSASQ